MNVHKTAQSDCSHTIWKVLQTTLTKSIVKINFVQSYIVLCHIICYFQDFVQIKSFLCNTINSSNANTFSLFFWRHIYRSVTTNEQIEILILLCVQLSFTSFLYLPYIRIKNLFFLSSISLYLLPLHFLHQKTQWQKTLINNDNL